MSSSTDLVKDLWALMKHRKRYWLLPLVSVILLLTALAVFAQGSVIAPFIYTLF